MMTELCECGGRFAIGFLRCPHCERVSALFAKRMADRPVAMDPLAPVRDLPFKELRAQAKALGLSAAGSAQDLAARIAEHEQMAVAAGGDSP